jgi:hypothetical protein
MCGVAGHWGFYGLALSDETKIVHEESATDSPDGKPPHTSKEAHAHADHNPPDPVARIVHEDRWRTTQLT